MEAILIAVKDFLVNTVLAVVQSFSHNWLPLLLAVMMAVALKTYVNSDKLKQILLKRTKVSIVGSVLLGAFTPFCACGTTAVILGMLTTTLPWGPIMAFLTSSPLMSPDGFIMIWGVIGPQFAIALTVASIVIGLASGFLTHLIERKTHYLDNQTRYQDNSAASGCSSCTPAPAASCSFCAPTPSVSCACTSQPALAGCSCGSADSACQSGEPSYSATLSKIDAIFVDDERKSLCCRIKECCSRNWRIIKEKLKLRELGKTFVSLGLRQILLNFAIFVAIGYAINYFIPSSIVSVLLGKGSLAAIPLAAVVGLPLYVTTESGIPIITSLLQSGASEGAMLAFIITGSATSAWVIAGISTFMKKRAVGLYLAFVVLGGILSGYLYELAALFI
ncbi:permease [Acetanaerobacterium elongatum]|uniref:Predicted permease n=1 Tax=Acetanaerobacterium elongatum TaxID=258515 RepID=A0A1G9ZPH0_9FIRM|nr:permease [Acetanaerobacterium elongatum]SDN23309.1 Predicted permease [Acetanaerobacterium elongatum]